MFVDGIKKSCVSEFQVNANVSGRGIFMIGQDQDKMGMFLRS